MYNCIVFFCISIHKVHFKSSDCTSTVQALKLLIFPWMRDEGSRMAIYPRPWGSLAWIGPKHVYSKGV